MSAWELNRGTEEMYRSMRALHSRHCHGDVPSMGRILRLMTWQPTPASSGAFSNLSRLREVKSLKFDWNLPSIRASEKHYQTWSSRCAT